MIAVALNHTGLLEEQNLGQMFVQRFADFKVVKLNPYDETKAGQLALCQSETYAELMNQVQKDWDPSGTFLELRGKQAKLQRAVRQMLFFDPEKNFERVLLDGCDGIRDFPWAIQIVILQMPVRDWGQKLEWIKKADMLVIKNAAGEKSSTFFDRVKIIRPQLPIFTEKLQEGWSKECTESLESLFAGYLEKRQRIKAILAEKCPAQSVSCEQASRMAANLGVSRFLFGNVCDEYGYSISHCGFGCF